MSDIIKEIRQPALLYAANFDDPIQTTVKYTTTRYTTTEMQQESE